MGPPMAEAALRKAISYGADDAVLVTDRVFAGSDTLATSYALASAISQISKDMPVDLVFTGKQTIDGDTAQVGPGVAKRLDMQLLTYVSKVRALDTENDEIVVERRSEGGVQVLKTSTPCLITVLEGNNEMRFATMANMFRASRYPVKIWNKEAAGIEDVTKTGLKGSPTVVSKVFAPTPRAVKAEIIQCESNEPADLSVTLLAKMFNKHPKLEKEIAKRAV